MRVTTFRRVVWEHYRKYGRHDLPWRQTTDPYKILVSEVMLQQTQVPRVIGKYKKFLKAFPNVRALAKAPLSRVLKEWSGLGYNRRAKYLHEAAKMLAREKKLIADDFTRLPGVGPYTASAIRVFAFNEPDILIETNIRTALIHHFCQGSVLTHDRVLKRYLEMAAEGQDPRKWHWALMDYGAYLKRMGVRNNHQSAHYTKQSKFEGSVRQVRGAILRMLAEGALIEAAVRRRLKATPLCTPLHTVVITSAATRSRAPRQNSGLPARTPVQSGGLHCVRNDAKVQKALVGLEKDGLIKKEKGKWRIA